MIYMITQWYPSDKYKEVMEKFLKSSNQKLPDYIKKWQVFGTPDGTNGIKSYQLVMVERGKVDEANIYLSKMLLPYYDIAGWQYKIEPLRGMSDFNKVWCKS